MVLRLSSMDAENAEIGMSRKKLSPQRDFLRLHYEGKMYCLLRDPVIVNSLLIEGPTPQHVSFYI